MTEAPERIRATGDGWEAEYVRADLIEKSRRKCGRCRHCIYISGNKGVCIVDDLSPCYVYLDRCGHNYNCDLWEKRTGRGFATVYKEDA